MSSSSAFRRASSHLVSSGHAWLCLVRLQSGLHNRRHLPAAHRRRHRTWPSDGTPSTRPTSQHRRSVIPNVRSGYGSCERSPQRVATRTCQSVHCLSIAPPYSTCSTSARSTAFRSPFVVTVAPLTASRSSDCPLTMRSRMSSVTPVAGLESPRRSRYLSPCRRRR